MKQSGSTETKGEEPFWALILGNAALWASEIASDIVYIPLSMPAVFGSGGSTLLCPQKHLGRTHQ